MTHHTHRLTYATAFLLFLYTIPAAQAQQPAEARQRDAAQHFKTGMKALATEHYDEAETAFKEAVRLDPLFDGAFYGLGQVYMATKRFEPAIRAYLDSRDAFVKATTTDALNDAASQRRLRDEIDARKDYVRTLQRQVSTSRSPTVGAAIDRNQDQIRQLEGRLSRNRSGPLPIPAGLSMALGSAYFRNNQLADAEREYKAAIAVNPDFGEAHNNLAVVYLMTGRFDDADKSVQAAERSGFKVNPQLKQDIRAKGGSTSR
jgi:protein O-GlcNAc transferase